MSISHAVQFCNDEVFLIDAMSAFIKSGSGESVSGPSG